MRLATASFALVLVASTWRCPLAQPPVPEPPPEIHTGVVMVRGSELNEEQLQHSRPMGPAETARAHAIDTTIATHNLALDHDATLLVEGNIALTRGRHGLSFSKLNDQTVGWFLRLLGEWEEPIMELCASYIKPGDTVWEAGAHIGSHTIGFARLVSADGAAGHVQ